MKEAVMEADRWRSAFKEVATLVGFTSGPSREPDPQAVVCPCLQLLSGWKTHADGCMHAGMCIAQIESVQRMKTQGQAMQVCCWPGLRLRCPGM
jgi:hypothetical protein